MVVLNVTNCPMSLRGDLSKWFSEVNTGVYIGKMSGKVRDELWERVCNYIGTGQATMVYSANNEQGYVFRVYNTSWTPIDYDGITLMRHPHLDTASGEVSTLKHGFSKASKHKFVRRSVSEKSDKYVVIDIETTGLDAENDSILEIGAIKIIGSNIVDKFSCLVKQEKSIPKHIVEMTGLTDAEVEHEGIEIRDALNLYMSFVKGNMVLGYNVGFDLEFLKNACEKQGVDFCISNSKDILRTARKKLDDVKNFKLESVAEYFSLEYKQMHRALADCELEYRIYLELNEID